MTPTEHVAGVTDPLDRLRSATAAREAAALRRRLNPRRPVETLLDLASNDYLGLARDPRTTAAAADAARVWGGGSTGSRLVTGSLQVHAELEQELASFTGAPVALVFSSGYLANLGTIAALGGPDVLVVSDERNHASLIDACRLSRSRVCVTPHADIGAVEAALRTRYENHALVVTDAVFSVGGDVAPLDRLHAVARDYGALLVVDEAHALGIVGPGGRGAVPAAGLTGEPDVVRTVTLSKALGAQGGAVLGPSEVIETLVDTARAFIFDTGLAPAAAGAALASLRVLAAEPDLATAARTRTRQLAAAATATGLTTRDPAAAILPLPFGEPTTALAAAQACQAHGVRVGCFRPPSVPPGQSCLRLTGRANLTEDEIARAAAALAAAAAVR